jgi:tetratricopeptide (TPR) repeat protein
MSARPALLLVHLEPSDTAQLGDDVYRTIQPCRALGELDHVAVVSGSLLSPELATSGILEEADLLVICDVADPDLLPIIDARRRKQRLTVYEINTHLLDPPSTDETAGRARDLVTRSLAPHLARHADCLQLTTLALESRFGHLNTRRAVFPSHLWEAPPPPPMRTTDRIVIGWGGSLAHREDLRWVLPALRGVLDRHAEVSLAVMGDPRLRELFSGFPADRFELVPNGSLEDYYRFLDGVDIGIAPLLPTEFNRCRSDVRFLEYAAHQALTVCSDLEPYQAVVRPALTGFLFRDVAELETVLERALAEIDLCAAVTARSARYVTTDRLERRHAGDRLGFYLSVATQLGFPLAPRQPVDWTLLAERSSARTFPDSRYVALGDGELERLLRAGLAHQRAGDTREALRCFVEAGKLAPGAYMPPLLRAGVEPDVIEAIRALTRAEALNPRSCAAPYRLGERLAETGDRDGAAAAFHRARVVAPTFGAPQQRLGELAEEAGRVKEACQLYEEAALQNGAFALPIARLANVAMREGRIEKAVGLLERSLDHDPGLWLTNLLVGRAYIELKRFHQARVHLQRALDGAEDRGLVLTEIAKAEIGLGNLEAARGALEEAKERV